MNENVQRNIKNMAGRNYLSLVAFVPSMVTLFTQLSDKDYHNILYERMVCMHLIR